MKTYLHPKVGERPISAIGAPELQDVLRRVEVKGLVFTATRLREPSGQTCRWPQSPPAEPTTTRLLTFGVPCSHRSLGTGPP